jgi:hypothetical protein
MMTLPYRICISYVGLIILSTLFSSSPAQATLILQDHEQERGIPLVSQVALKGTKPTRRRAGGKSGDSCSDPKQSKLAAIVPGTGNEGELTFTKSKTPIFGFYVPFSSTSKVKATLTINGLEQKVDLPTEPGIVFIQMQEPLKTPPEEYTWYFTISCDEQDSSDSDIYVNGQIQLLRESNSAKDVWDERLRKIINGGCSKSELIQLLTEIKLEDLMKEKIVKCTF